MVERDKRPDEDDVIGHMPRIRFGATGEQAEEDTPQVDRPQDDEPDDTDGHGIRVKF